MPSGVKASVVPAGTEQTTNTPLGGRLSRHHRGDRNRGRRIPPGSARDPLAQVARNALDIGEEPTFRASPLSVRCAENR